MLQRILGAIGAAWGGAVVVYGLTGGASATGNAAYDQGRAGGLLFGAVTCLVGLYYLTRPAPKDGESK